MNYRFQNLLDAPYHGGDTIFAGDSSILLSVVGNRVASTDLAASSSLTLAFESSSNVTRLVASSSGDFLLAVDDNGHALYANLRRRAVLHRVSFKGAPSAIHFILDGQLIVVAIGRSCRSSAPRGSAGSSSLSTFFAPSWASPLA
jgi:periodic tryptophan protein 2